MLAVTLFAAVVLAPFLLENKNLVGALLLNDLAGHAGAGHGGRANLRRPLAAQEQHVFELDNFTRLPGKFLNFDNIVRGNAILFAASADFVLHPQARPLPNWDVIMLTVFPGTKA